MGQSPEVDDAVHLSANAKLLGDDMQRMAAAIGRYFEFTDWLSGFMHRHPHIILWGVIGALVLVRSL